MTRTFGRAIDTGYLDPLLADPAVTSPRSKPPPTGDSPLGRRPRSRTGRGARGSHPQGGAQTGSLAERRARRGLRDEAILNGVDGASASAKSRSSCATSKAATRSRTWRPRPPSRGRGPCPTSIPAPRPVAPRVRFRRAYRYRHLLVTVEKPSAHRAQPASPPIHLATSAPPGQGGQATLQIQPLCPAASRRPRRRRRPSPPHQGVVVLEAMKMQNELKSPRAARVAEIRVTAGGGASATDLAVLPGMAARSSSPPRSKAK